MIVDQGEKIKSPNLKEKLEVKPGNKPVLVSTSQRSQRQRKQWQQVKAKENIRVERVRPSP